MMTARGIRCGGRGRVRRPGIERLERRDVPAIPAPNGVITLYGTTAADVMLVEPGDEPDITRITGSVAGRPFLLEYSGAKRLVAYLGSGDDTFENWAALPVTVFAGDGHDQLTGGPLGDRLSGDNGDDVILGEGGNDWLYGNNGNDAINGGLGSDTLDGGYGNDSLDGGQDRVVDVLIGGAGADTFFVELMYVNRVAKRRDQIRDFKLGQGDFVYSVYPNWI